MTARSRTLSALAAWSRCRMLPALLILWGVWGIAGSGDAADLAIDVRASVEVVGESIQLGDLAQITGADPEMVDSLRRLPVARSPQPGIQRRISIDTIRYRLKQNGYDPDRFQFGGSDDVRITRAHQTVGREQIRQLLEGFIRQQLLANFPEARVKAVEAPEQTTLPAGRLTIRPELVDSTTLKNRVPVHVHLYVDGNWTKKVLAIAEIEVLVQVAVARHSVAKGRSITASNVFMKTMDLADLPSNTVTRMESIVGKRARNPIGALEVIRTDMVEQPPLVKRGDIVQIIAESDQLRVSAVGMVRGIGGRENERIQVVNIDSQKVVFARVVDAKTVTVDFLQ